MLWTFVFQSDIVAHHHPVEQWAAGRPWAECVAPMRENVLVVEVIGHAIWTVAFVVSYLVVVDHHHHLEWGQYEVLVKEIDYVLAHVVQFQL